MEQKIDLARPGSAVSHGDASLAYEHLSAQDGSATAPMLILLHGVHSNEHDMLGLASYFDRRFQVVSARAPETLGPGAYGWFQVQFTADGPIINEAQERRSRMLLSRFVDEMRSRHQPSKVFLYGFSQGGIMALSLALTQPGLANGNVVMNGRLLREIGPDIAPAPNLSGVQVFMANGIHDDVMPIARARAARTFLSGLPLSLEYREYPEGHRISPAALEDANAWLGKLAFAPK